MRRLEIDNWFTDLGNQAHLTVTPVPTRTEWLDLPLPEASRAVGWHATPDGELTYSAAMANSAVNYAAKIAHDGGAAYLDYIILAATPGGNIDDLPEDLYALAFHVQAHAMDGLTPRIPRDDAPAAWVLDGDLDPSLLHLGVP